jgi:hypothetical protein
MLLCVLGLVAQAEVVRDTAFGNGADTFLTNDDQSPAANNGPDGNWGSAATLRAFRVVDNSRIKIGYIRFDISDVAGDKSGAYLTLDFTYIKGSSRQVTVWGLLDGANDYWVENQVTYNTAGGFIPNPPTALRYYDIDESEAVSLGTFSSPSEVGPFSTDTATLDLTDFLNADLNGLVTFFFIGSNDENEIASKENTTAGIVFPTLTLPNARSVARASDPFPADYQTVTSDPLTLSWTNPEPNEVGGIITCDVYFGTTEPNVNEPHFGLTLLQAGIAGNSVAAPQLSPFETYYWVVNINDTTLNEVTPGMVWTFDTNNSPPVVNAGPDQYVWLNKAVVAAGSAADTYMRDAVVRGAEGVMDIRGGSLDFAGYLRFDLSELTAMGPGTLQNAKLTLKKVAASRNDAITTGRFSLHGLNNVAGNTPQNWSEATLSETGTNPVGAEWTGVVPMDLTSGRITNLDMEDGVAVTETIANDVVEVTGAALEAFLKSRVDDNGLVTFIIACEDGNDRGYGIASKENATVEYRPQLTLTYVPDSAGNNGDAEVLLDGTVTDDGLPSGIYTVRWEQLSGPETVAIDPNDIEDVTVYISTSGFYEFRLTADDTNQTASDVVRIYVGTDPCDAAKNTPNYTANVADFNGDCLVNIKDFATFALQWLDCNSQQCP